MDDKNTVLFFLSQNWCGKGDQKVKLKQRFHRNIEYSQGDFFLEIKQ